MGRVHLIALGAVLGLTWAASLRGFMQQLAGPTSTFTYTGTFGVIIATGATVGALLGWAEYQPVASACPARVIIFLAPKPYPYLS